MTGPRNVAILLFPNVELLDFSGPYEVFTVANRWSKPPAFQVYTVAESREPIAVWNGLTVNPQFRLWDCPPPDLLLVPGGRGSRTEMHNPTLLGWIQRCSERAELVLSVCTGALLLARAGLLDGRAATTHQTALALLRELAPRATIHADLRFVDNGKVMTSAGIAAGIDLALHVVGKLLGAEHAARTARYLEYARPG